MKASCYLLLENRTTRRRVPEFAIIGCRKTKPDLTKNQVAVKVNVTLPDKTFEEFIPEASITLPDEMMLRPNVEVEVESPDDQ